MPPRPDGPPAVERVETLLERAEALTDPVAREITTELLRAVLDVYGAALGRVTAIGGETLTEKLAADEQVSPLLLLHDLHPWDARTRIDRALAALAEPGLDDVRLDPGEGDWESVARVRLRASGGGCGSAHRRTAIEAAILGAAPEVGRVEFDEVAAPPVLIPVESMWPVA